MSVTSTLSELYWLPVQQRFTYKLCLLMHLVHTGHALLTLSTVSWPHETSAPVPVFTLPIVIVTLHCLPPVLWSIVLKLSFSLVHTGPSYIVLLFVFYFVLFVFCKLLSLLCKQTDCELWTTCVTLKNCWKLYWEFFLLLISVFCAMFRKHAWFLHTSMKLLLSVPFL